jgi:dihydropteroate synthase
MTVLDCGGRPLDLSRPRVMGILNVTPDSFSDGGRFTNPERALARGRRMLEEGAAIIDVGGESTRPGARPVGEQQELDRVVPVIEALSRELDLPLSVDTAKPAVMRAAVAAGAGLVNDVLALGEPGALEAAGDLGVPVCLMHMQGRPRSMQQAPYYEDVVGEVRDFLAERIAACLAAGIPRARLLADPGFGFGKTLDHNLILLRNLDRMRVLGVPLLVGISRKSMIGTLVGRPPNERLAGSLAAAVLAVRAGARVVRTHDVGPTVDALTIVAAVDGFDPGA